jgi:hypothetical protein
MLLPAGTFAALPSCAGSTHRNRIRSAGAPICFATVPLMIAGLRQSTDSRQLLGSALNNMFFSFKKVEIKFYIIYFFIFFTVDFIKKYTTYSIVKHLHKHHIPTSGKLFPQ